MSNNISMAELPMADIDLIDRACDNSEYVILEPPAGQAVSWASELGALRNNEAPLLRQQLMEQFGAASMYQGPSGEVFMVPHDTSKPCVEIKPGGVS